MHVYGKEVCGANGSQIKRGAKRARRQTAQIAREHHFHAPVVKSRGCTAIACTLDYSTSHASSDPVGDWLEGAANEVIHRLLKFGANATLSWSERRGSPALEACAKEASEAWVETAELRAVGAGDGPEVAAGTEATSAIYAAASCVGAVLGP